MNCKRILITGANGFVGRSVCSALKEKNLIIRKTYRRNKKSGLDSEVGEWVFTGDLGPKTDWEQALKDVHMVVHLAARVHVLKETTRDPLAKFRQVNVVGTEHLARMAAKAGVQRLVYVSSIGVNGEKNNTKSVGFSESNPLNPFNPYTVSKWEAEKVLHQVASETGLTVVILRPPLVYGPSAPGNFDRLINIIHRGLPLPLTNVQNKRSFIFVRNLASAIVSCIQLPQAAGQTYLVSDGENVSTPELIRRIANALGSPARLFPFPPVFLRMAGRLTGKSATVSRLLNSLVIDSSKIRRELAWTPPYSMAQGLKQTAEWFKSSTR